ncbi:MAG: hypothetical protein HUJ27_04085 [Rhodobacteraceae bacterium]|nr:hypothetical protein [Paracoccaceae bacterium]
MKVIVTTITRQQGSDFDQILVVGEVKNSDITATFQIAQKVKAGDPLPDDLEKLMESRAHELLTS